MQREQPGKERQGETRWNEKKRRSPSLEHQIGQIAPNNLSDCRKDEQQCGPNHDSGTGINRCSHFNPPQHTTPAEPSAVPPTENNGELGAMKKTSIFTSHQVVDHLTCSYQNHESEKKGKQNSVLNFQLGQEELIKKYISCPPYC
jgi:hypothetical protein